MTKINFGECIVCSDFLNFNEDGLLVNRDGKPLDSNRHVKIIKVKGKPNNSITCSWCIDTLRQVVNETKKAR